MSAVTNVLGKEGADFGRLLWDDMSIRGYVVFGCDDVGTSVMAERAVFLCYLSVCIFLFCITV